MLKDPDLGQSEMKKGVLQGRGEGYKEGGTKGRAHTLLRAVVLSPWVVTPMGIEWPFQRGHLRSSKIMFTLQFIMVAKLEL